MILLYPERRSAQDITVVGYLCLVDLSTALTFGV